jgi:hypothetical protein
MQSNKHGFKSTEKKIWVEKKKKSRVMFPAITCEEKGKEIL